MGGNSLLPSLCADTMETQLLQGGTQLAAEFGLLPDPPAMEEECGRPTLHRTSRDMKEVDLREVASPKDHEDHVFDDLPPTEKPTDDVLHEEINEKPRDEPKLEDPPKHEPTENEKEPEKELQPEDPLNNLSPPKDGERLMFIHSNCKRVGL